MKTRFPTLAALLLMAAMAALDAASAQKYRKRSLHSFYHESPLLADEAATSAMKLEEKDKVGVRKLDSSRVANYISKRFGNFIIY